MLGRKQPRSFTTFFSLRCARVDGVRRVESALLG